jgi:hypothetical protein
MINPQFIAIAIEKTSDPRAREHLKRIETLARELVALERDFPSKVAASKSKRGEKPTKLRKDEKAMLAEFDEDIVNIDREALEHFRKASSSREILEALTFELPGSPRDWSFMVPKANPEDRALIEEVVAVQRALDEEMKRYLETYPST